MLMEEMKKLPLECYDEKLLIAILMYSRKDSDLIKSMLEIQMDDMKNMHSYGDDLKAAITSFLTVSVCHTKVIFSCLSSLTLILR